jgi:hypothetical protein
MPKHPDSIHLHPLSLTPSSKWSLDSDDLEQAMKPHMPKPPSRAWFHPIHRKATTRHPYIIGDPILHPNSSTGYTFEGWAGPSVTNAAGERVRPANFRQYPAILPPYNDISINLYHGQRDAQTRTCSRPSSLTRLWKDVIGWIRQFCGNRN